MTVGLAIKHMFMILQAQVRWDSRSWSLSKASSVSSASVESALSYDLLHDTEL
jgi:hypothetical protein